MEFAIAEMDEKKLELSFKENIFSDNFDQTDSNIKSNVQFAEVINKPLIQEKIKIHEETIPSQEKFEQDRISQIKEDSISIKDSNEKKYQLIEENNIDRTIRSTISLNNFSHEYLKNQESIDIILPQEKCLQKSSSCNDIRSSSSTLFDALLCTSSDIISNYNIKTIRPNKCKKLNIICNDEEETIFSTKLHVDSETKCLKETDNTHEKYEIKNNIKTIDGLICHSNVDKKLIANNDQTQTLTNLINCEKDFNKEQKPNETIKNSKLQNNIISKPTLVDDSRLVKISLPTNPINIMQSNAQFLNKSRNFLNFITEKSTNIMEKALLPQHLTLKYNSVMKSVDNIYSEKKYIEESSNMEHSLREPVFNNISDSFVKGKNISYAEKCEVDIQSTDNKCVKNENNENNENKIIITNSNEIICENIEKNNKYLSTNDHNNDFSKDLELKRLEQSKSYVISNDIDKTNDIVFSTETDGNYNINSMILNSGENNFQENIIINNLKEKEIVDFEKSKQSLLQHPVYLTLLKDYADLKSKYLKLQEKIENLEEKKRILKEENKGEIFSMQIETLEKTINRLTFELHTSLEAQEIYKKDYNIANKERESMVMKYAVSEKQLIDTQRAKEYAERKVKEMTTQQETLQNKLREMQGERTRICNILSNKHREMTDLQKEVERLKEDVKMRDIKLQWTQNKLKTEMDLQKETQQKLDKAMTRINEMKEECEQVRKETQETMRKFQQSEENKAVTLDQQLKEQQARLILERHVTEDKEMLRIQLQKEVDTLKHRQQILIEENNTLSLKIQDAEKDRLTYESNLNNLKIIVDQRQKEIMELHNKVSELETLKTQLQHKNQYLASTEVEIQHLRLANEELQSDMFACRQKEAEMLDFTQKLTDKNVRLQSEFTVIEAKVKQLEQEHGPLREHINQLNNKVKTLEESCAQERKTRIEECEILTRHLAEQTQTAQNLAEQLEDSQGQNAVLKRKQQLSMKEMTRELQQCRKKLEAFETLPNSLDTVSRTGSNVSLNTADALNGALSDNNVNGDQNIQLTEPSRQLLIDRIIKLQESNARKAEKLDFFEEHTRILVEELQKKKRIIQNYILHENIGAMGNNERDKYKAELARHGGIMASVYNQRVSDDNMTLELSLEINQKLQAVLEDALFKNITLKDNIDTLGEEIARLTMQNQQRQNTK
ncbi:coiled-coil domain-containing protein 186 isoform X3 [Apis florea]|uniref:coiled-coil domain-containing protein 186 isoform X3 n=1 Tax=Apis florea TaxID=7463 RepID=UPI0012FE97FE|nr:coiled-coil domain-containing protein 186 isoform X3 [Apis florea]